MSLIRGDALTIPLADQSVDLIVTSPPYFALRSYTDACGTCGGIAPTPTTPVTGGGAARSTLGGGKKMLSDHITSVPADPACPECDGSGRGHYAGQIGSEPTPAAFIDALIAVTRECVRVLKPSGSLFVNLGDKYSGSGQRSYTNMPNSGPKDHDLQRVAGVPDAGGIPTKSLMGLPWRYALRCIDDLGLILRAEIIWSKPNGLPESVQDRVRRSHEQWFHFTLEPRYYSSVDEIREAFDPSYDDWQRRYAGKYDGETRTSEQKRLLGQTDSAAFHRNPLGKLPGSVWTAEEDELWLPQSLAAEIMQRVADGEIDAQEAAGFLANDPPRTHEQWFHFTLEPRYYSAVDEIREAHSSPAPGKGGLNMRGDSSYQLRANGSGLGEWDSEVNPLGKLPGSVWQIATEPLRVPDHLPQHFAAFPSEWPRRIILGWSPSGICVECGEGRRPVVDKENIPTQAVHNGHQFLSPGHGDRNPLPHRTEATITGESCACRTPDAPTRPAVVLDPFAGTGTSVAVANHLGRHGIGIDLSADYLKLARWRCQDPGLRAKVLRVDKPAAEVPGQMVLL